MKHLSLASVLFATAILAVPARAENLLVPLPEKKWNEAAAVHLLRRAAFEGTPAEVRRLSRMKHAEAVDYLVNYESLPKPATELVLDPKLCTAVPREWLKQQDEETRQRYRMGRNMGDRHQLARVRAWWLERMITSPRQLEEKMTLFWHGHFTSGYREVRSSYLLLEQNRLFRDFALGNYRDMLVLVSADPAMLYYLDSAKNNKTRPNENFARELMELFTLGEGNYTEYDIKEAARAFTGWGVEAGKFKFRKGQHDFGIKTFRKQEGNWNGEDIIDIILQDNRSHRFIVSKLWAFFCYDKPEKSVIDGLSATLRKNDFELKPVVRQILMSGGFYSTRARGRRIKSPVQLTVGTLRMLGIQDCDYVTLDRAQAILGQQLFQPPNVKGWDGGEKWINTATVYNRYNFCGAVVNGHEGNPQRGMMEKMAIYGDEFGFLKPRVRENIGLPAYNPSAIMAALDLTTPKQIVGFFARRMLAVQLPDDQRAKLEAFIAGENGNFNPAKRKDIHRVRTMIHLLMSTPEYQLY
jgi:uncharacterized protein (DUF1800 family)